METALLREFVVLAQYLNFTSAAKALVMSQSTLSRHVAELERSLGAKLVTHAESTALTPAGEALLDEVDALLSAEDRLIGRVAAARPDVRAIRIEEYPYSQAVMNLVSDAVGSTVCGGERLRATFVPTKGGLSIEDAVEQEYFDVAVTVHLCKGEASFGPHAGVAYLPLPKLASRLCFYLDASNPVLKHAGEGGVALAQMSDQRFVLPLRPEWGNFREDFATLCRASGFDPSFVIRRTHGMSELGTMDMDGLVLVITDADVANPDSMFLRGERCKVVRCSDDLVAVPALVFGSPFASEQVAALADRIGELYEQL